MEKKKREERKREEKWTLLNTLLGLEKIGEGEKRVKNKIIV